ncbi:MAG TPA: ornithine carbamoyltransferase [Rickettsiales bacterium]|nr:ornithine carbamoyltransferase [Rickettsiales bacterium]
MPNFIDLNQINPTELRKILDVAKALKAKKLDTKLEGKQLAMIFEKSSTRTRISFEVAINQLGGNAVVMNKSDTQLGKGETVADTAKVLSRFVDIVMARVNSHKTLLELSQNATIPVINALSDFSHPCQIMASVQAIEEHLGDVRGKKLAWFGDANNVLNSYIHGAVAFSYELNITTPKDYNFCDQEIVKAKKLGAKITQFIDAKEAAKGANVLIADTWFSMGDEAEKNPELKQQKLAKLSPYKVTQELMDLASPNAIFTHCLPAYRGYEVEAEVIDGTKSIVFDEAENRLHAQKAVLLWCCDKI